MELHSELEVVASCHICGASLEGAPMKHLGEWSVVECSSCGTGITSPRPSPDSMIDCCSARPDYYTHTIRHSTFFTRARERLKDKIGGYPDHSAALTRWAWTVAAHLARPHIITSLPFSEKRRRLLDVGCGSGETMLWAKERGWDVFGIDSDPTAVNVARARGLGSVLVAALPQTALPDASFDAITAFQVLEHVQDPLATLRELKRLLAPGGALYITVPNYASVPRMVLGEAWEGCELPLHLTFFTPLSLRRALESSEFTLISLRKSSALSSAFRSARSVFYTVRESPVASAGRFLWRTAARIPRAAAARMSWGDQIAVAAERSEGGLRD